MSKAVFITGTGTDMGKTYLSGLIVKKLAQAGKNQAYYKAAMSGNDRRADGSLIPGDALFVKEMSGISQSLDDMCPYVTLQVGNPLVSHDIPAFFFHVRLPSRNPPDCASRIYHLPPTLT